METNKQGGNKNVLDFFRKLIKAHPNLFIWEFNELFLDAYIVYTN